MQVAQEEQRQDHKRHGEEGALIGDVQQVEDERDAGSGNPGDCLPVETA